MPDRNQTEQADVVGNTEELLQLALALRARMNPEPDRTQAEHRRCHEDALGRC